MLSSWIRQSYFLLGQDCPNTVEFIPDEFAWYLENKWNVEKGGKKHSSSHHTVINNMLDVMRVAHQNEYSRRTASGLVRPLEQNPASKTLGD